MPLSISTNVASLSAQRAFMGSNAALETAFERLLPASVLIQRLMTLPAYDWQEPER